MFKSWFNTSRVDEFVDAEVAHLLQRLPPASLQDAPSKKTEEQLARARDQVLLRTSEFVRRERPGFLQKARIANRLKWSLREAQYPEPFIDDLAYAVATVAASALHDREV
jgi:hypothetical protein